MRINISITITPEALNILQEKKNVSAYINKLIIKEEEKQ